MQRAAKQDKAYSVITCDTNRRDKSRLNGMPGVTQQRLLFWKRRGMGPKGNGW